MRTQLNLSAREAPIVVIGAGIGGLAAALRLAAEGRPVLVLEKNPAPGGKMRSVPSAAGPIAAGPTVVTMRAVFDDLFAAAGEALEDHVDITQERVLARHFWPDGAQLDLFADHAESVAAVRAFAGEAEAKRFERFSERARRLFDAFDAPMMQAAKPDFLKLAGVALSSPAMLPTLAPWATLARALRAELRDPRLRQLFGRYATYVGGSPFEAPAVLSLIWEAEARGVWRIDGGLARLARAIAALAETRGATFQYGAAVDAIETKDGRVAAVRLGSGERVPASAILFNGDPAALRDGLLGEDPRRAVPRAATAPRSLSAYVWSFAAAPTGPSGSPAPLLHHNVYFGHAQRAEFAALKAGRMPEDPTLYICAQDRGDGLASPAPGALERFEIIMNGPPTQPGSPQETGARRRDHEVRTDQEELAQCSDRTFQTLEAMGLSFTPTPAATAPHLSTPTDFASRFPGSRGSLYGRSPHGLTASFARPTARTAIPGLYLAGGGAHPGAGVPMAALSGKLAAEAIGRDLVSRSKLRPTATRGGISTVSARTGAAPSR
ncbi:MAG: 1-hydroxycarotenoid 3,4-desaturase CrtD [Pseudomonadota bacterium]